MEEKLKNLIATSGPIPFPAFFQTALYDADHGYYTLGADRLGKSGDFFTSVSVGPLFGTLLAHRFLKYWEDIGSPRQWRVIEIGAHDGKLAADILTTLREISPPAWEALEYTIPEPLLPLRQAQASRLTPLASTLNLPASLEKLPPLPGIAFGNEILDALPFHLIKMISGKWQELHVHTTPSGDLAFIPLEIAESTPLHSAVETIGTDFPENYLTEVRTSFPAFLNTLTTSLTEEGLLLFLDYGFAAPEYYDTHRSSGTLRTFSNHKAAENPLATPGLIDITAHVDFTTLAHAAAEKGYHPTEFTTQGSYLTHLAKPLILSGALNNQKAISQFQTLTHPAHLGAKFHAIEFRKNAIPSTGVLHRLALL
ncbi:MAG: class I SAM-dependent methyltransferase [Luteolibacter sp.]